MCDYSLEMYRSRPAVAGEPYETRRFTSGSIGFIAPGAPDVAVCMACDTRLEISNIPAHLQLSAGVAAAAPAIFTRIETGPHHDGIRFGNGAEVTLQQLGPGVRAVVVDALTSPARVAQEPRATKVPEFAELF
jgi:hypothetical protein